MPLESRNPSAGASTTAMLQTWPLPPGWLPTWEHGVSPLGAQGLTCVSDRQSMLALPT